MTAAEPGLSCPGLRVLFVNWRDRRHPEAGGAETFVDEVATRLVAAGALVTLFTARSPGAPAEEDVDGVRTVRRGGRWTVYPHALRYLLQARDDADLVIDCQNGLPFFSPLVLRRSTAVVLLIHHVHQDQFVAHFPAPLAQVGQWLEGPASRAVYGHRAVAVVSPSTRTEVRRRLRLRGPVHVVPNGITNALLPPPDGTRLPRSGTPTIVCVGRLVVHKRLTRLLDAVPDLLAARPGLQVHIVGDGPEREQLQERARALGVTGAVTFHGRVPADARDALLGAAWLTVHPSMGEGWGLSVLEAAAQGVPAVAADVPGLRDAVLPGRTGWLLGADQPLAGAVLTALAELDDDGRAAEWAARCTAWSRTFTWERTARRLLALGLAERARRARRPRRDQRRRSDLVTWAELRLPDARRFDAQAEALLRSADLWQEGPDGVWLLCHACDEVDLLAISERLGAELVSARVATGAHLLGDLLPGRRHHV